MYRQNFFRLFKALLVAGAAFLGALTANEPGLLPVQGVQERSN